MRRLSLAPRPDWQEKAAALDFAYAQPDGRPYWDEGAAYAFTLAEIENDIEKATADITALCGEFVGRAVRDETYLTRLNIPFGFWDFIATSWTRGDRSLYGRYDFMYSGQGPAKLLEFNADTPTALYEAAVFQWFWLEDMTRAGALPEGADQFNSLHDKLIAQFRAFPRDTALHMTAFAEEIEDRKTVEYLRECALEAGHAVALIDIAGIGRDGQGRFVGSEDELIQLMFKLYPWEWLIHEPFGATIPSAATRWIEPPWKMLLSTKALMPELWRLAPGHPNLLEAYHEDDPKAAALARDHVSKPIFSREGANVRLVQDGRARAEAHGPYDAEKRILQAVAPPAVFDGKHPVIGSWIIGDEPAGVGVREGDGPITDNLSRFVPHVILD